MNASSRSFLLCILLTGACLTARLDAQSDAESNRTAADVGAATENAAREIPFELVANHLILSISVNGSPPLRVLLDTGMPGPGLVLYGGPRVQGLSLSFDPKVQAQIGGVGGAGEPMVAKVAMEESLELEGLVLDKARVMVLPSLPGFGGYHEGILGYELFGRFVVEIDYEARLLQLHDPTTFEESENAHVLPLTLHRRLPHVTVGIKLPGAEGFEAPVGVGLGASHAIMLHTGWSESIVVPEPSLEAIVGRGLSGAVEGRLARIEELQIGGVLLENVIASFPIAEHQNPRGEAPAAGTLGGEVLRRFKTTFDYAGGRLILIPNKHFDEPFEFDRSGLSLGFGSELEVEGVIAGSPADESGLRIGDVITHLNGEPATGADFGRVHERLRKAGQVRLVVRRGDQILGKTLVLRPLI